MGGSRSPSRQDLLRGITSPMLLLAYAVAIPLIVFMLFMAGDLHRAIPAAESERYGLGEVSALDRFLVDAAADRTARACGQPASSAAAVDADIAAVEALERQKPFAGDEWQATLNAWRHGTPDGHATAAIANVIQAFRKTADETMVTYDPEVRGIDIADALTYRLPGAFEAFRRAQATLCDRRGISRREQRGLERDAGQLQVLLADSSDDVIEAISLDPPDVGPLAIAEDRADAASAAALASVDAAVDTQTPASRRAAARATGAAADAVQHLISLLAPSLKAIVEQRLVQLHERLVLTLLPSIVAILAAVMVVVIGVRGKIQSVEMKKLREHQLELRHQATHDALTALKNRAAFFSALEETIDRCRLEGGCVAVLFLDLDNFKTINDTHGHAAGDEVLRIAAQRLRVICSEASGRMTARLGGDEFAMLLADADPAQLRERVSIVCGRIALDFRRPLEFDYGIEPVSVSASVGIAVQDGSGPRRIASEMLREADAAMYQSKGKGRDCASSFTAAAPLT